MSKFTQKKVISHFRGAAEEYAFRKGVVHPEYDPVIMEFIRDTSSPYPRILEVGGGSGYFLDLVAHGTPAGMLCNCELTSEAYRKQANESIDLVGGAVQWLPFKDGTFDFVVFKNLLHHLVGGTRRKSREICRQGIDEVCRVVKNGGYLILLEQYNEHRLCASTLFYLTLLLSVFGASFKFMGIVKNTIVPLLYTSRNTAHDNGSTAGTSRNRLDRNKPAGEGPAI